MIRNFDGSFQTKKQQKKSKNVLKCRFVYNHDKVSKMNLSFYLADKFGEALNRNDQLKFKTQNKRENVSKIETGLLTYILTIKIERRSTRFEQNIFTLTVKKTASRSSSNSC